MHMGVIAYGGCCAVREWCRGGNSLKSWCYKNFWMSAKLAVCFFGGYHTYRVDYCKNDIWCRALKDNCQEAHKGKASTKGMNLRLWRTLHVTDGPLFTQIWNTQSCIITNVKPSDASHDQTKVLIHVWEAFWSLERLCTLYSFSGAQNGSQSIFGRPPVLLEVQKEHQVAFWASEKLCKMACGSFKKQPRAAFGWLPEVGWENAPGTVLILIKAAWSGMQPFQGSKRFQT